MKQNTIKMNINEIKKISSSIPKTINEALNFNGEAPFEDNEDMMDNEQPAQEPMGNKPEMQDGGEIDVENFINETRKRALKIMAKLADTPENPIYDLSKRIWQICDKAYNDQKEQQQQQNGMMQQQKSI